MRIARHQRQPAPRLAQHDAAARGGGSGRASTESSLRGLRRPQGDPALRRGRRRRDGPAAVTALREAIADADAVLFATPEYNSSIPGVLKNAIDWASRPLADSPLRNKPVAVIGASTGMFGAVWAQAELRKVLGATGARVAEVELASGTLMSTSTRTAACPTTSRPCATRSRVHRQRARDATRLARCSGRTA